MANRIAIGQMPDGSYGMRVSMAGYDVLSNPVDNEKLIFSSDWPATFPIYAKGSYTKSSSRTTTDTVAFAGMGFTPVVFVCLDDGTYQHWYTDTFALGTPTVQRFSYWNDASNIYIVGEPATYRYVITRFSW